MTDKNISSLLELGYGSIADVKQKRLISKEGGSTIQRRGQSILDRFDLYHMLIGMSWMKFHLVVLVLYVSINIIFALAYYLVGVEHLAGIFPKSNWEDFLECFFFSTQAFTTVGYGRISPEGYGANIIAAIESMSGLLGFALATGLLYGRFAKPKAKLMYSNKAVIGKIDNQLALMFRVANQRSSQIIEVEAQTIFAYLEIVNEKPKDFSKS